MNKAVFFDRDGTIIVDKFYLNNPDEIEYLDGVFENLKKLKDAGYLFVIVTNQSGVARGWVSEENLDLIHKKMAADFAKHDLKFEAFYYAPYMPESDHPDRKPNPGMLLKGAEEFNIDLKSSWMIGDKMSDVECGHRAGAKSILIGQKEDPKQSQYQPPTAQVETLSEMTKFILDHSL